MIDINVEDLDELQKNRPMISLTFDKMLKAFFDRNPIVFKRFISSVLHLELLPDEINLKVKNSELPVSHYNEYSKTIDFYADINGTYLVDIELNNSYFSSLKIRNKFYHEKKMGSLMKKGMTTKDIKKLGEITNLQLNLNVKDKSTNLGEDIVVPYSIVSRTLYVNNDKTYIRYLDYYRNLYYNDCNELDESDYWLAF